MYSLSDLVKPVACARPDGEHVITVRRLRWFTESQLRRIEAVEEAHRNHVFSTADRLEAAKERAKEILFPRSGGFGQSTEKIGLSRAYRHPKGFYGVSIEECCGQELGATRRARMSRDRDRTKERRRPRPNMRFVESYKDDQCDMDREFEPVFGFDFDPGFDEDLYHDMDSDLDDEDFLFFDDFFGEDPRHQHLGLDDEDFAPPYSGYFPDLVA